MFIKIIIIFIFIQVDKNRKVFDQTCNCVAQNSKACKHIYAPIYRINNDRSESKTSFEQQWGKPSASQLVKEICAKGMTKKLFQRKSTEENIEEYVEEYIPTIEDLKNTRCPLRSMIQQEYSSAEDRRKIAIARENAQRRQEEFSNNLVKGCALSFINMSTKLMCNSNCDQSIDFLAKKPKNITKKM